MALAHDDARGATELPRPTPRAIPRRRLPIREIDARRIDAYKAAKRTQKHQYGVGYSAASINNHLSLLHRVCAKAVEYGVIESNPVRPSAWVKADATPQDGRAWWTPVSAASRRTAPGTRPGRATR